MNKQIIFTLITLVIVLVVTITTVATRAGDTQTGGVATTTATITNTAPVVDVINFSEIPYGSDTLSSTGILPSLGASRTIYVTGTISDQNGDTDITSANVVFHRTYRVTDTCTPDDNNCYTADCTLADVDGADTTASYSCTFDLAYWIDATDSSSWHSTDSWSAYVTANDAVAAVATSTATIEVNSLLGINLPESINYGTFDLDASTTAQTNQESILTQRANTTADLELSGTDMTCDELGSIPTANQAWAIDDVAYADSTALTETPTVSDSQVALRTSETQELTTTLYWNIHIPATGVKGVCTGANTISIVAVAAPFYFDVVTGGFTHTAGVYNGTLWAWGDNATGQLGQGDTTQRESPTQVGTSTDWSTVALGANDTIALKTDGTLWVWGNNSNGQLGLGDTDNRDTPTQVGTDTNWSSVTAGRWHTLGIKTDGTLWAWGKNSNGQLGLGDTTDQDTPTQVGTDTNWSSVTGGWFQTLALKTDGTLWAWGKNLYGGLGQGDTTQRETPTQVGTSTDWSTVVSGGRYGVALKSNGTLWSWGANSNGQLGLGDTTDRYTPTQVGTDTYWSVVGAGGAHTLALKTNGTLWSWGANSNGQLGLGDTTDRDTPTKVGTDADWSMIAGGNTHTVAVKTDNIYWAWGYNLNGKLGFGDTDNRTIPSQN